MTDPTPNNLPVPTPLSPAAQAVLDAYWETFNAPLEGAIHRPLAAALRAIADQVVPEDDPKSFVPGSWSFALQRRATRRQLLAIATELENHQ